MRPLRDRIIVRPDPERTFSGIIVQASKGIVDSQAQLGKFGTVISTGPDVDRDQLRPGDRICFGEFEYPKTPSGELVLQDKDVCGVIQE